MNSLVRRVSSIFKPSFLTTSNPNNPSPQQLQQWRGIKVRVRDGNLEQALVVMQRKMISSGMERLIKRQQRHHLKNSEKRVLARKNLERKVRSQELSRKLKSILIKKVSKVRSVQAELLMVASGPGEAPMLAQLIKEVRPGLKPLE
ncbi:hypothetical protein Scep_017963 [Stephania cephalantha]|uniref:Uncharacterized protein n=1 Tax=Stephania cephalantha TaxID=152367 RepID=A0AAP0IR28_9MAGN